MFGQSSKARRCLSSSRVAHDIFFICTLCAEKSRASVVLSPPFFFFFTKS